MATGSVKVTYHNGDQLGPKFKAGVQRFRDRQVGAIQQVAREAAAEIEAEGRANIRAGGNFGSARWQDGFRAKVSFKSQADLTIRVTHAVPYWVVFEEGRVIRGKPLLWIPMKFGDSGGVRAREYHGKLFRVNREGRNPLLVSDTGVQYVGVTSVKIPRKWHLRDIVKRIARSMRDKYRGAMRSGR